MSQVNGDRASWHQYFMALAQQVATRSTCLRRHVGCIAVDPRTCRILATGYNGAPGGLTHCTPETCYKTKHNIASKDGLGAPCKAVHAEQNMVVQAATTNISLDSAVVFCTHQPCTTCTKLLIGIHASKVLYLNEYPDPYAQSLWDESEIQCVPLTGKYLYAITHTGIHRYNGTSEIILYEDGALEGEKFKLGVPTPMLSIIGGRIW